jgi:N-methylhydantoinase A
VLSACGGLFSDVVGEASLTRYASTRDFPYDEINELLSSLTEELAVIGSRLVQRGVGETRTELRVEARYPSQSWELEVPLPTDRFRSPADVAALCDAFHRVHDRVFAVHEPGQSIECLSWRGRLTAPLDGPVVRPAPAVATRPPQPPAVRPIRFAQGWVDTPRYLGTMVSAGVELRGPAVIDEATTTVVIPPGASLCGTRHSFVITTHHDGSSGTEDRP